MKKKWKKNLNTKKKFKEIVFQKILYTKIMLEWNWRYGKANRYSDSVSHKIYFAAYGLHRDHPQVLDLVFSNKEISDFSTSRFKK